MIRTMKMEERHRPRSGGDFRSQFPKRKKLYLKWKLRRSWFLMFGYFIIIFYFTCFISSVKHLILSLEALGFSFGLQ